MVGALTEAPQTARSLLILDRLPGVGPATVRRLVETFGSAERALRASSRRFESVAGVGASRAGAARARRDPAIGREVDVALERARALGMRVLTWDDERYPAELRPLSDPPPVLFLRGRAELLDRPAIVTVVGARRATARGRDVAERLGIALGRAGVVVASGLALGIDGCAHAGALRVGGATVAVLGTGADVPYPRTHRGLFDRIAEKGLLVTEFMPGTAAAPHHFPRRNRILAALASRVVVVEAGRRSGSLITVDHALDLGREVWSVPGPIDAAAYRGSNLLLVDGASPLVSIDAFVRAVRDETGPWEEHAALAPGSSPVGGPGGEAPALPAAEALERGVLDALTEDVLGVDEVAERFGLPTPQTLAILTTLELHGEVERLPGMRFRRAA